MFHRWASAGSRLKERFVVRLSTPPTRTMRPEYAIGSEVWRASRAAPYRQDIPRATIQAVDLIYSRARWLPSAPQPRPTLHARWNGEGSGPWCIVAAANLQVVDREPKPAALLDRELHHIINSDSSSR